MSFQRGWTSLLTVIEHAQFCLPCSQLSRCTSKDRSLCFVFHRKQRGLGSNLARKTVQIACVRKWLQWPVEELKNNICIFSKVIFKGPEIFISKPLSTPSSAGERSIKNYLSKLQKKNSSSTFFKQLIYSMNAPTFYLLFRKWSRCHHHWNNHRVQHCEPNRMNPIVLEQFGHFSRVECNFPREKVKLKSLI